MYITSDDLPDLLLANCLEFHISLGLLLLFCMVCCKSLACATLISLGYLFRLEAVSVRGRFG